MKFAKYDLGELPNNVHPPYKSTVSRGPLQPRVTITGSDATTRGVVQTLALTARDSDLTAHGASAPLGPSPPEQIAPAGHFLWLRCVCA